MTQNTTDSIDRHEINCRCGKTTVGETREQAEENHLLHFLNDHNDLTDEEMKMAANQLERTREKRSSEGDSDGDRDVWTDGGRSVDEPQESLASVTVENGRLVIDGEVAIDIYLHDPDGDPTPIADAKEIQIQHPADGLIDSQPCGVYSPEGRPEDEPCVTVQLRPANRQTDSDGSHDLRTDGGNSVDGSERPAGQVCPNPDCHIDQRWGGFSGFACPECATRLVVACSKCDIAAVERVEGSPRCSEHVSMLVGDGGRSGDATKQCKNCNGTGMVGYSTPHYAGTAKCPDCDGEGVF